MTDISKRDTIKAVVGTVALGALSGGATAQTANSDSQGLQEATFLLGDFDGSPNDQDDLDPDGPFFRGDDWEKTRYAYIVQNRRGEQYKISQDDSQWYGLADLIVAGELDLGSPVEIAGSGDAPTEIQDSITLARADKVLQPQPGRLQLDTDVPQYGVRTHCVVSVSGANTEFALSLGVNGTRIERTEQRNYTPNASSPTTIMSELVTDLEPGDYVSAYIENVGGTADATIERYALTI